MNIRARVWGGGLTYNKQLILHQTTNYEFIELLACMLYIIPFLHQTTTIFFPSISTVRCISFRSYIKPQRISGAFYCNQSCISFRSYIKPQLSTSRRCSRLCCISFRSYIKPQLVRTRCEKVSRCISFRSYIKPQLVRTRCEKVSRCISFRSYIKPQLGTSRLSFIWVVYHSVPTSNHNHIPLISFGGPLYIIPFLHQTTTSRRT